MQYIRTDIATDSEPSSPIDNECLQDSDNYLSALCCKVYHECAQLSEQFLQLNYRTSLFDLRLGF